MRRLLPLLLLLIPCTAQAQNARVDDIAFKGTNPAQFAPAATITVCTSSGTGLPCTPKVSGLCSSASDVTCNQPNPTTADSVGNFGFWIQPGTYVVSVTGSGLSGFSKTLVLSCPLAGSCTFTGTQTFTGLLTCKNFQGIRCVDGNNTQGWAGADQGARIASAMAALSGDDGTIYVFDSGTWSTNIFSGIAKPVTIQVMGCPIITISTTQIPANANMKVVGMKSGCATIFSGAATGDLFAPSGSAFELGNFQVRPAGGITRTAGYIVNPAPTGNSVYAHDILIVDQYNGFKFVGAAAVGPSFAILERISWTTSALAHTGTVVQIGGGDGSFVSDLFVEDLKSLGDLSIHDTSPFIVDGGTDTLKVNHFDWGYSQGSASTVPVIAIQNTTVGADPRWVRFKDISPEGGSVPGTTIGGDCVSMSKGNNVLFEGSYFVSCRRGIVHSGGNGLKIIGGVIGRNYQGGYVNTAAIAPSDLLINGVDFSNNSGQTTNTTDDIAIFAGTTDFNINGNKFGALNIGGNKSRDGISIGAGANNFNIGPNNVALTNLGTAFLADSSGATVAMIRNGYDAAQPLFKIVGNSTANGQFIQQVNSAGSTWNLGEQAQASEYAIRNAGNGAYAFRFLASTPALRSTLHISDLGTACTNGELALSAGWQSSGAATVTAVAGTGQTCSWTITTGTTTAANPTITDTLTNALPTATTVCYMNIYGGSHTAVAGESLRQTTLSATAPIFTANFTPTAAGTTYFVTRTCGP